MDHHWTNVVLVYLHIGFGHPLLPAEGCQHPAHCTTLQQVWPVVPQQVVAALAAAAKEKQAGSQLLLLLQAEGSLLNESLHPPTGDTRPHGLT